MTKSLGRKIYALIVTIFLGGSLALPLNAHAAEISSIERLAGPTKNQTAIEIALKLNPGIAPAVVLATPKSYADALVGIPLALQKEAPLLWVGNTPQESKDVLDFVKEHCDKKGTVYILGSEGVIPKSFEAELQKMGFQAEQIQRLGGKNRYETAVQIAQKVEYKGNPIYITAGEDYAQAVSTAVLAAAKESPILLLPSKGNVPDSVITYLNQIVNEEGASFQIIGNNTAIPVSLLSELKTKVKGLEQKVVERMSGDDLFTLMAKANAQAWVNNQQASSQKGTEAVTHILLTTGKSYADSIPGAILAARVKSPLIFMEETLPQPSAKLLMDIFNYNRDKETPIKRVTVLGGTGALSPQAVAKADSLYSVGESLEGKAQVWTYAQLHPFSVPSFGVKGEGNKVIITDAYFHALQAISSDKSISTVAGKSSTLDDYGMPRGGYSDGSATQAMFNLPKGIALDDKGILYVEDTANGAIRTVDKEGNIKTLINGLNNPTGIALGAKGEIYVTETLKHRILKIDSQGQMVVLAGGGYALMEGEPTGAYADGQGEQAQFNEPQGLAIDDEGNLYVADTGNQRIRKVSPEGVVTALAGSGTELIENTSYIQGGYADGEAKTAQFNFPMGLAVAKDKTVYVADSLNHCIRVITPAGEVNTLAGVTEPGKGDGSAILSQFNTPSDVILWEDGSLLIVDQGNALIRQYIPAKN